jgi:hypothetical protein
MLLRRIFKLFLCAKTGIGYHMKAIDGGTTKRRAGKIGPG